MGRFRGITASGQKRRSRRAPGAAGLALAPLAAAAGGNDGPFAVRGTTGLGGTVACSASGGSRGAAPGHRVVYVAGPTPGNRGRRDYAESDPRPLPPCQNYRS